MRAAAIAGATGSEPVRAPQGADARQRWASAICVVHRAWARRPRWVRPWRDPRDLHRPVRALMRWEAWSPIGWGGGCGASHASLPLSFNESSPC